MAASDPELKRDHEEPVCPQRTGTCNELACPGDLYWSGYLQTLQLLSLLSISPLEFLPPDLGAPAQSRKESQIGMGCGRRIIIPGFSCRFSGCADLHRARCWWGGRHICRYKHRGRPTPGERIHPGSTGCLWSARELCFPDIWKTFPGIWAVITVRLGRVSGEELPEVY